MECSITQNSTIDSTQPWLFPESNGVIKVPQELIKELLGYLSFGDRNALYQVSKTYKRLEALDETRSLLKTVKSSVRNILEGGRESSLELKWYQPIAYNFPNLIHVNIPERFYLSFAPIISKENSSISYASCSNFKDYFLNSTFTYTAELIKGVGKIFADNGASLTSTISNMAKEKGIIRMGIVLENDGMAVPTTNKILGIIPINSATFLFRLKKIEMGPLVAGSKEQVDKYSLMEKQINQILEENRVQIVTKNFNFKV